MLSGRFIVPLEVGSWLRREGEDQAVPEEGLVESVAAKGRFLQGQATCRVDGQGGLNGLPLAVASVTALGAYAHCLKQRNLA